MNLWEKGFGWRAVLWPWGDGGGGGVDLGIDKFLASTLLPK